MSVTGQAMSHVLFLKGGDNGIGAKFWAARAADSMHLDLKLAPHIKPYADGPGVGMVCNRCGLTELVPTLAQAADFRDRHYYCGEDYAVTTVCPDCRREVFAWEDTCRFCGAARPPAASMAGYRSIEVDLVLRQRATYHIARSGGRMLATIEAPSMRMAKAAAFAMMPGEQLSVWLGHVKR